MKRKIFITGGRGFIGKNIIESLGDKYDILAPFHKELDLLDKEAVREFMSANPVDMVIYAANVGGSDRFAGMQGVVETNLKMFFNVVENKKYFERMIFLGSGAEYDKSRDLKLVSELEFGKRVPVDDYGFAKYSCSKYIEDSENIINLRSFGVYGKYEDAGQRFISIAINKILVGLPLVIKQNVKFDYLYVNDLVKIIDYFIENRATEKFYNACTASPVDLLSVVGILREIAKKELLVTVENPGWNKEYSGDNSKLLKEIPSLNFTDLKQGVENLYRWYETEQKLK